MQLAPVNYLNRPAVLDYLVVLRMQPSGRVDRLHVAPTLDVRVDHHDGSTSRYRLDAGEAEDLLHALGAIATNRPRLTSGQADDVRFDIEIGWRGHAVRLHSMGIPEDEAIAGVLQFARNAFDRQGSTLYTRRHPATA